ncbi:MAG: DUF3096 domain-containing protein [Halobacteriales archaeon]|nr:DUF3096 domain-containing protein [Halobacteriales archaeon]
MAYDTFQRDMDATFRRFGVTGAAAAVLMVVFGILILVFPYLVGVLVGLYLIVVGLLQLMGHLDAGRAHTAPPPPAAPPYGGPPMP